MANKDCVACAESIQAAAKLCKHCGTRQDDKRFSGKAAKKSPNLASKPQKNNLSKATTGKADSPKGKSPHSCPVCKSSSSVQKVSSVIDSGISQSSSTQLITSINRPFEMFSGQSFSSSVSDLSSRLEMHVPFARFNFWWLPIGVFAGTLLVQEFFLTSDSSDHWIIWVFAAVLGSIPGVLIGTVAGFIMKGIQTAMYQETQDRYFKAKEVYRASFYCSRDDIVFDKKGHGEPESFQQEVLARFNL